jgi:hypothetical protein
MEKGTSTLEIENFIGYKKYNFYQNTYYAEAEIWYPK